MSDIIRFGISMNGELLKSFDTMIKEKGYLNRSEAIRDLIRDDLVREEWAEGNREVAGTITIIYDHHVSGLNQVLNRIQHDHHHLFLATMHVHLDEDNCLETIVVRGAASEAQEVAEKLISTKGVKHGKLTITSTGKKLY